MTASEAMRRLSIDLDRRGGVSSADNFNVTPGTSQTTAIGGIDQPELIGIDDTHWGFLPSWQTRPSKASINMRIESADTPYWRKAFQKRRCAVPANWWYEWVRTDNGKQPFALRPGETEGFFFAGVWSIARGLTKDHRLHGMQTFAILTGPAHSSIEHIHHRMTVALNDEGTQERLSPSDDSERLRELIRECSYPRYESWPVSRRVNSPKYNDKNLVERVQDVT